MAHVCFWVDSEPSGDGRWTAVLSGSCDHRAVSRLLDEGRALALLGATEVDVSLAGVTYLDARGARALDELTTRLGHLGVVVRVAGAIGQPAELLELLARGGTLVPDDPDL